MKVLLFGASGMVGKGVLLECLDDPRVEAVVSVGRRPCGVLHPKLTEIAHADFSDPALLAPALRAVDACFFCLGVSSAGMSEAAYTKLTYDLTIGIAHALARASPDATFCYVTGAGTDSSERGRSMWARVKGRTENELLRLFPKSYMFRPAIIVPLRGVRSNIRLYQFFYVLFRPLLPKFRTWFPRQTTTSVNVGRAMIAVAARGDGKRILETADINRLGSGA